MSVSRAGCGGRDAKTVHFVRHAEATHNVGRASGDTHTYLDPRNLDAPLTAIGRAQCEQLACAARELSVELVVTSPLTRAIEPEPPASPPRTRHGCSLF